MIWEKSVFVDGNVLNGYILIGRNIWVGDLSEEMRGLNPQTLGSKSDRYFQLRKHYTILQVCLFGDTRDCKKTSKNWRKEIVLFVNL